MHTEQVHSLWKTFKKFSSGVCRTMAVIYYYLERKKVLSFEVSYK